MLKEKKINKSGSITIPADLRRSLGIQGGEKVALSEDEKGNVILKRIEGSCIVCGSNEKLTKVNKIYICSDCAGKIKEAVENVG